MRQARQPHRSSRRCSFSDGGSVEKWREESLQDASQKLHDERVSPVKLDGLYARLMAFSRRSRLGWWNYE